MSVKKQLQAQSRTPGGAGNAATLRESHSRRRYPRTELKVKARLFVGDGKRQFEATLPTANISIGGIFFESTFFLKVGQRIEVELKLPPQNRAVRARGQVVRIESLTPNGVGKSGFAVRFDEYLDSSDVVLANYFLGPVLREFIQQYAKQNRVAIGPEFMAQATDLLAAWELARSGEPVGSSWAGRIDQVQKDRSL